MTLPAGTQPEVGKTSSAGGRHLAFLGLSVGFGIASAIFPPLSVFGLLVLVIALASLTRLVHARKAQITSALVLATLLAFGGLYRFALGDALQGIIEARGRETSKRTVSLLREFLFAQDAMRRYAFIDPDEDGVGSAGLLGELCGARLAREEHVIDTPPLAPRYAPGVAVKSGAALLRDGYLFMICLPKKGGGWTATPGEPIDEELAERRWVAYAWPESAQTQAQSAFFIDQHERILESDNTRADEDSRLVGARRAPACDDFEREAGRWSPWKGKQPRRGLIGDAPTQHDASAGE